MKANFLSLSTSEITGSVVRYSWIFTGMEDQTEGLKQLIID